MTRPICAPLIRAAWRVRITGKEHVPDEGPAVLASNHLSILDHFLLPLSTKRPVYYLSKAEHFDHRLRGWLFSQWGAIPLQRGKGDKQAVERGEKILRDGNLFGIYPEGTRSKDGRLYKGHTGVARIAFSAGAPIIPCAMIGTDEALPKGSSWPKMKKCEVRIGPPIDLSSFQGGPMDYSVLREVTDQVMQAIAGLSGQQYVDEYHPHPAYAKNAANPPPSAHDGGNGPDAGGSRESVAVVERRHGDRS